MTLTRKQFLSSMLGIAAGATLFAACGGDDGGGNADAAGGANCAANGTSVSIGGNHGHTLVVAKTDITAAAEKVYDIKGTSGHGHNVTISAAMFGMLAANTAVMTTSTGAAGDGHTHSITVSCA